MSHPAATNSYVTGVLETEETEAAGRLYRRRRVRKQGPENNRNRQYAMSLRRAARTLIKSLDLEPNPKTAWDTCPITLIYRQAIELPRRLCARRF